MQEFRGMQEFNVAMADLSATITAKKKEIAEQCRPILYETFRSLFAENPEVVSMSFRIATDIYDDENYEDGIEDLEFELTEEIDPDGEGSDPDDWFYTGPSRYTHERAAGNIIERQMRYDNRSRAEIQAEAQADIARFEAHVARIGRQRLDRLHTALVGARNAIEQTDIEFLKIVFGEDVTVVANASGFTVG